MTNSTDEVRDRLRQILRDVDAAGVQGSTLLRIAITDPEQGTPSIGPGAVVTTLVGAGGSRTIRSWSTALTVSELRQLTEALRLAENERYTTWEQGFKAGQTAIGAGLLGVKHPYPRNPYEHHEPSA